MSEIQCLSCEDIIESKHRHDFVTCKCGAVSADGGRDYLRLIYPGSGKPMTDYIKIIKEEDGEQPLLDGQA